MQPELRQKLETALLGTSVKQLKEARKMCFTTLQSNPKDVLHLILIGIIDYRLGHAAQASEWFEKALVLNPNSARLYYDYGKALNQQGKQHEAFLAFQHCIEIKPDFAEAHYRIGSIFLTCGDNTQAIQAFSRALSLKPKYTEALNSLGVALIRQGDLTAAAHCYAQALALDPADPKTVNNYGMLLYYQGDFNESIRLFERALSLKPNYPEAINNIGVALRSTGQLKKALPFLERSIPLDRNNADFHKNLAIALLSDGQLKRGWREFEWRLQTPQMAHLHRGTDKPLWNGEIVKDAVLLIRAEQGLGDTLQFCRYAPRAASLGLRVIIEVQPGLARLIGSLPGIEQIITVGEPLPKHDFYCPMMSLPNAFHTSLTTIPAEIPYLSVSDAAVTYWQNRLPTGSNHFFKVGLVWSGNPRLYSTALATANQRRSIAPDLLLPLKEVAGVQFYSLQKGGPLPPQELDLITLIDEYQDFADTAGLAANLDLIISVDTSVVHMAGALGIPVWVLNRVDSCWRWLQHRDDSPWYPTLRLFHQTTPGNWKDVVLRIKQALEQQVNHKKQSDQIKRTVPGKASTGSICMRSALT